MLALGFSLLTVAFVPEPHFQDTPFARAVRLIERGRTAEGASLMRSALEAHPDAPESPKARFVLGIALMKEGAYEEAAQHFERLARTYPLLSADHQYHRGQALYAWGNYLDAAKALAQVEPESARGREAEHLRAWALYQATDYRQLVKWLEGLDAQRGKLSHDLAMLYGRGLHRVGEPRRAAPILEAVWYEASEPKLVGWALAGLAALQDQTTESWRGRPGASARHFAPRLEDEKQVPFALERLEKWLYTGSNAAREVALARGRIAEGRRRYARAARNYRRAAGRVKNGKPVARDRAYRVASLGLGRVAAHRGDERAALAYFTEAAAEVAFSPEAEEARFRAAEILVRVRRYGEARAHCEALLSNNPESEYRRRCFWTIGWAHFRAGEYAKARPHFAALVRQELPAELDGASRYWMARCLAQLDRGEEAEAIFAELVRRYPLSYYAALAEAQLAVAPAHAPKVDGPTASDGAIPAELELAREYLRLGLKEQARGAIDAFQQKVESGLRLSARAFAVWAAVLDRLRQRLLARKVREAGARAYPGALTDPAFLAAARRAHPLEFKREIEQAARRFRIPVPLLFALVRTESGFKPAAVSAMGAYGLAQLILPTARRVGLRLGERKITRNRLLSEPALNVRLGAAYMRELLDRYQGSEPLALAGYNAGPAAVDAWMRRRVRRLEGVRGRGLGVGVSGDELAEEIPVTETRAFVKAVLSRARAYGYLYGRHLKKSVEAPQEIPPGVFIVEPTRLPPVSTTPTPVEPVRVIDRRFVARSQVRSREAERTARTARTPRAADSGLTTAARRGPAGTAQPGNKKKQGADLVVR